jgi:neprosin-like protein
MSNLDPALSQRQLNPELFNWLDARQATLNVVRTTTTPVGHSLDWVPQESQLSYGNIASPPPIAPKPNVAEGQRQTAVSSGFELYDPSVERGPPGTVPILRPNLANLRRTVSLNDFCNKRGSLLVNRNRPNKYPASLFNGGLGSNATWFSFGGEIFSSLPDPSQTRDQMGSGVQPRGNLSTSYVAYQRNLRIQTDPNGTMATSTGVPTTDTANGGVNPYGIQSNLNSGTPWESYFWVGGPAP